MNGENFNEWLSKRQLRRLHASKLYISGVITFEQFKAFEHLYEAFCEVRDCAMCHEGSIVEGRQVG